MGAFPIIAIVLALFLVLLLGVVVLVYRRKEENLETDYRVFFILGITWLPIGVATDNPAFWGMGAVFLIVGLANRDKWKDAEKWSDLSLSGRYLRFIIGLGIVLALALAVLYFFLARS